MSYRPNPTQLPVLCKRCGGLADLREEFSVHCPFCGAADRLPSDRLERALELKARIAQVARARGQLDATQAALVSFYERPLRPGLGWLSIGLIASWGFYKYFFELYPGLAGHGIEGSSLLAMIGALGVSTVGAIPLGLWAAIMIGRARYRRTLRPMLYAELPAAAGLPGRCRVCHAELPGSIAAAIRCSFCGALSLLRPEHHTVASRRTLAEEARVRREGRKAIDLATAHGYRMDRELALAWVGSTLIVTALLVVVTLA